MAKSHMWTIQRALFDRFCETLMVFQEYVLSAIGVAMHLSQRRTLEAPRFDLTKPQDEQVFDVNDASTTTTLLSR